MNQSNEEKDRANYISKALTVYERIPGNRRYAVDDTAAQSLGALAAAWHEQHVAKQEADGKSTSHSLGEIVPTFEQLTVFVPEEIELVRPMSANFLAIHQEMARPRLGVTLRCGKY